MVDRAKFIEDLDSSYRFAGESITLGAAMLDGECITNHPVKILLKTLNRHGLIAGATGTGKTKSLQLLAEGLSAYGIPSLLMDVKGDLSGISKQGTLNPKIEERFSKIGTRWSPQQFPVELLTLSSQPGVRLRATASEFGPVLLSKILDLNDTQQGLLSMIFKYCDDKKLPLLDLEDLKKVIQFVSREGKNEIEKDYGAVSSTSSGTMLRKIIELEQQGAGSFFGEPSFDPYDLLRTDNNGKGYINVIRLTDIQDRPKLFSTFMLSLLAEIYSSFPEIGDAEKPKLVIFIDEAHLIFKEASKVLLDQIETTIKLIRSKGVGVIFCTQNPQDIPAPVLSQLGLKIQHALRAFTAADRKTIKTAAENFPESSYYETDELLTQLGIGEALITALDERGIPTMLTATMMCSPASRMEVLTEAEIEDIVQRSQLVRVYNQALDRDSAFEMLNRRMTNSLENENNKDQPDHPTMKAPPATFEKLLKSPVVRSVGVTIAGIITRSLLGSLGLKSRTRTTRRR
jgi:DNA helicase HerA-like ATPase